jgi:TolB-like protein
MTSSRLTLLIAASAIVAAATASAQCPNGTPPPCDTRPSAPMTLIKRAAPPSLDDRTYIVLPFYNVTRAPDAEWLGEAAVNMMTMDLSRWQDIKVIDDRRVADYLRDVKVPAAARLSTNDALAVARRAGAGRVVTGDVMKVGNRTTITATLINGRDGRQIRSARTETTVADSILPAFGKLAREILAVEGAASVSGTAGTSSVEAYKEYVAGNKALGTFDATGAKKHYEAALAIDSTFALAHYKWAIAASYDEKAAAQRQAQVKISDLNNIASVLQDRDRIAHARAAARLASPLPARERALIAGLNAYVSYDFPRACESYAALVKADSSDIDALYGYGVCLYSDDAVVPVAPGDTTKLQFRTSWNQALDMLRRAVSLDPTFHLAFDPIVSILTSSVRTGCARPELLQSCADTAIRRRYVALVQRAGDTLVTAPRSGYKTVLEVIVEGQRTSPLKANIELASRAAADWLSLAPGEGRAHWHLANLLLRLGRAPEAERQLAEAMKDPAMRNDTEVFFRRLETALKLMHGSEVIRLIDTMPTANPTELGRANANIYAMITGRYRAADSSNAARLRGVAPPEYIAMANEDYRATAGVFSDSLAAIERTLVQKYGKADCAKTGYCINPLVSLYTTALRQPHEWPDLPASMAKNIYLAPASALARNDTAALRTAANALDSLSSARAMGARNEDGSTVTAIDAFLILGDSLKALNLARRLTDSTLQTSAIEGSTATNMPTVLVWPRALLLRADLEAARGDKAIAKDFYQKFLALWANADPEFAPLLERVRRAAR